MPPLPAAPVPATIPPRRYLAPQGFGLRSYARNPATRRPPLCYTPPSPSPHRTNTAATTDPPATALTPAHRTASMPRQAWKRSRAACQHPLMSLRAAGRKARRPRVKLAFRPRRQKQGPLRGESYWGGPQTPAIMPRLTPGHLLRVPQPEKGRYTLIRPAPPSVHWWLTAPKPLQ